VHQIYVFPFHKSVW